MTDRGAVFLLPPDADLLACAARQIVADATHLPDLANCVVLLPDLLFASELRRHLLHCAQQQGHSALLGPTISTLSQWLDEQAPASQSVPGRARRELLLVEAILQHPEVFGEQDPWTLADSLLTLFDELTLYRVTVDADPDEFRRRLQSAYGLAGKPPEPFDREARIVQCLWQAWHQQLQAENLLDPAAATLQQLAGLSAEPSPQLLYFVGIDDLSAAEADWIDACLQAGNGRLLLHCPAADSGPGETALAKRLHAAAPAASATPAAAVLDAIFQPPAISLQVRAAAIRERYPDDPLVTRLHSFAAGSPEQEARAIDLQIRRWLLEGCQPLAIVTEDRRLGRRVRALLERAGIILQDPGGWALSTTRAAAALERWLQTVEEDFAHEPLLDTLKSPFTCPDLERDQLEHCVFRFETDIVRREQIASGLQRYRHSIDQRLAHLHTRWNVATTTQLHALLDRLDRAAEPLRSCLSGQHAALQLLECLQASLQQLGIWQAFDADSAGQRIQQEWRLLHAAATQTDLSMDWNTFRSWLGSALERHDFQPPGGTDPVWLLNLQQARLGRFAGIVIGASDSEHLPPVPARAPFFNDRVRQGLGLPGWPERHRISQQRFRVLLESAPRVLLTWHRENNGELRTPSAWLARIAVFRQLAWQSAMAADDLAALVDHPQCMVSGQHPLSVPGPTVRASAVLPPATLPAELSVSAHGTLIDCPYRFYAASVLRLKAREEVRQALEKADYGSLIHTALEIFHQGRSGYPAPLAQPLDPSRRTAACEQLVTISRQLFSRELEDNFEHRAWLRRWLELVEPYVDWLMKHQHNWRFEAGEREGEYRLAQGHTLAGRIDRMDRGDNGTLIIDYKTGQAPDQQGVDSGEAVQLPSYALLQEHPPYATAHVLLGKRNSRNEVWTGSQLEGDALHELSRAVAVRLDSVLAEIASGTALPAWGDDDTCKYCEMDGLCRKSAWPEA